MIKTQPAETSGPMNKAEATAITKRIRNGFDALGALLLQAQDRKAWKALGYENWESYWKQEFGYTRQRYYQLVDQGKVAKELAAATGDLSTSVDISEAAARDIKPVLEETKAEIKARIEAGEDPKKAVAETVKAKRTAKAAAKQPAGPDHSAFHEQQAAALPQFVKDHQQATAEWRARAKAEQEPAERVAELEQEVTALAAEIAALTEENAKFEDMRVQFEQGGYDKVIAGKDEEIRVLKARLTQESEDKAGWVGKAKTWQKRALELGWSNDTVIQIEQSYDEVIPLD